MVFTALTTAAVFLQHGVRILNDFLSLSIYAMAAMLLSGASVKDKLLHSSCAAIYWTALAFFLEPPFLAMVRTSYANRHDTTQSKSWLRSQWLQEALAGRDLSSFVFHTTLAVTIVMQILNLYDRGWQWQRWPVPMIVGSSFGWVLGNMLFAIKFVVFWKPTKIIER